MFFRPGYLANLVPSWIPALDGVEAKLDGGRAGGRRRLRPRRLDGAAGPGLPALAVRGLGLPRRVDRAGPQARRRGGRGGPRPASRSRRRRTSPGRATTWSRRSTACTTWATRSGAARHVREALAPDGTWLIVEPFAGDTVADNLNPVGRVYYNFSTYLCVPNALSQPGG